MINDEAEENREEHFQSLLSRYQIGLETSMKGSTFAFDCVHLLYYKYYKVNPNCGGSYTVSPNWIKNKKSNNKSYQ